MPLSRDPTARKNQLANLQAPPEEVRAKPGNRRSITHGAEARDIEEKSAELVAPIFAANPQLDPGAQRAGRAGCAPGGEARLPLPRPPPYLREPLDRGERYPKAIQERLGHSSIQITMDRYGHLLPGLDDALAAGLEAAYTGGAPAEEVAWRHA